MEVRSGGRNSDTTFHNKIKCFLIVINFCYLYVKNNFVNDCATVSAVTATAKSVTTAVDQTLTCTIRGLTANGAAATVVWKDPDGTTVADNAEYDISYGTPDGIGTQSAELTIKAAKLTSDFASVSSFTYKCAVKSSLYPNSPMTSDIDIIANVLKLGKNFLD